MSRLSDTTFPKPFFLAVKMRCITSMDIKIFTIDVAGQCENLIHYFIFNKGSQKQGRLSG